jgi:H(+)-transporting ATP synthase subunit D
MSAASGPAPTRMNLLRMTRRLERVRHGVGLLRRKREALVARLFGIARPAADARAAIAEHTQKAWAVLLPALARHGDAGLRAIGWPTRDIAVAVESESIWGIPVATITGHGALVRSLGARATAPGGIGAVTVRAAAAFEGLTELLLDAAPREMLIRRLGEAVARTSRQVHTLERRVAPTLTGQLHAVRQTLDEREREERLRHKHLTQRRRAPFI